MGAEEAPAGMVRHDVEEQSASAWAWAPPELARDVARREPTERLVVEPRRGDVGPRDGDDARQRPRGGASAREPHDAPAPGRQPAARRHRLIGWRQPPASSSGTAWGRPRAARARRATWRRRRRRAERPSSARQPRTSATVVAAPQTRPGDGPRRGAPTGSGRDAASAAAVRAERGHRRSEAQQLPAGQLEAGRQRLPHPGRWPPAQTTHRHRPPAAPGRGRPARRARSGPQPQETFLPRHWR